MAGTSLSTDATPSAESPLRAQLSIWTHEPSLPGGATSSAHKWAIRLTNSRWVAQAGELAVGEDKPHHHLFTRLMACELLESALGGQSTIGCIISLQCCKPLRGRYRTSVAAARRPFVHSCAFSQTMLDLAMRRQRTSSVAAQASSRGRCHF